MGRYLKEDYPKEKIARGTLLYLRVPELGKPPAKGEVCVMWRDEKLRHHSANLPAELVGEYSEEEGPEEWGSVGGRDDGDRAGR
jgi:hypothetical protein